MENSYGLWELLDEFQTAKDKNESFNIVFVKFEPLLMKYAWKLGDKDAKYMLAEALYSASLKIPLNLAHFKQDKYILGYLIKSIYTEYIKISKFNNKTGDDYSLDDKYIESSINETEFDEFWYNNLLENIYSILSSTEKEYFTLRYILDYSETEIAKKFLISRQAVNKRILKIKKKLIKYIQGLDLL